MATRTKTCGAALLFVLAFLVGGAAGALVQWQCAKNAGTESKWSYPSPGAGGFVNAEGNLVIPLKGLQGARQFSDGMAAVCIGGKYGFIDLKGNIVIPPRYDEASGFDDGLGRVRVGARIGFVDPRGRMVIKPQFEDAGPFSDGLAAVKENGLWGYIDQRDHYVISPTFMDARTFSEGLAAVSPEAGRWEYIDQHGTVMVAARTCFLPQPFKNGHAKVKVGDHKWAYFDWRGHPLK